MIYNMHCDRTTAVQAVYHCCGVYLVLYNRSNQFNLVVQRILFSLMSSEDMFYWGNRYAIGQQILCITRYKLAIEDQL